jgi:hypothetical protein
MAHLLIFQFIPMKQRGRDSFDHLLFCHSLRFEDNATEPLKNVSCEVIISSKDSSSTYCVVNDWLRLKV